MTTAEIRMAMAAMADPEAKPKDIARELGVTTTTLYTYVNGDGSPKPAAVRCSAGQLGLSVQFRTDLR